IAAGARVALAACRGKLQIHELEQLIGINLSLYSAGIDSFGVFHEQTTSSLHRAIRRVYVAARRHAAGERTRQARLVACNRAGATRLSRADADLRSCAVVFLAAL